ncbi:MAG: hypothetical protein HQL49_05735 [Gammaproteobacteria bacterium]|nr:hypothetical protein [Gammaproteobacteria bacterium]
MFIKPLRFPALLAAILLINTACSHDRPYEVTPPPASSRHFNPDNNPELPPFVLVFQRNSKGEILTREVESEGEYIGGGRESYLEVESAAREAMLQQAVDSVNGVLVQSNIEIMKHAWTGSSGAGGYQNAKQRSLAQVLGTARPLGDPDCQRRDSPAGTTYIHCRGRVEVPLIERLEMGQTR